MSNDIRVYNNNNSIEIECDDANDIITITTTKLENGELNNNCIYKITVDGKVSFCDSIIKSNTEFDNNAIKTDNCIGTSKSVLIKDIFQSIPENLSQYEMEKIKEFSEIKIVKTNGYGEMYPYNVKLTEDGDIQVIMLMYNGNNQPMELTKFPLKLVDANDKVIILDFIDINTTINPNKIGICQIKVAKNNLLEENIDLARWSITFEVK